jgi:hypothetical protein
MVRIKEVFVVDPNEFLRRHVSLESRYGTWITFRLCFGKRSFFYFSTNF